MSTQAWFLMALEFNIFLMLNWYPVPAGSILLNILSSQLCFVLGFFFFHFKSSTSHLFPHSVFIQQTIPLLHQALFIITGKTACRCCQTKSCISKMTTLQEKGKKSLHSKRVLFQVILEHFFWSIHHGFFKTVLKKQLWNPQICKNGDTRFLHGSNVVLEFCYL